MAFNCKEALQRVLDLLLRAIEDAEWNEVLPLVSLLRNVLVMPDLYLVRSLCLTLSASTTNVFVSVPVLAHTDSRAECTYSVGHEEALRDLPQARAVPSVCLLCSVLSALYPSLVTALLASPYSSAASVPIWLPLCWKSCETRLSRAPSRNRKTLSSGTPSSSGFVERSMCSWEGHEIVGQ